jgi:hypothetical protein
MGALGWWRFEPLQLRQALLQLAAAGICLTVPLLQLLCSCQLLGAQWWGLLQSGRQRCQGCLPGGGRRVYAVAGQGVQQQHQVPGLSLAHLPTQHLHVGKQAHM